MLGPRQYDPTTARFTTPDVFVSGELELSVGADALTGNRYLFAAANPVAFFEDGHWPWSKNRLYKQYRTVIRREAKRFGIDPVLLAAVIQHEGNWRQRFARFPSWGRMFRRAEEAGLAGQTLGIGQMRPDLALRLARDHFKRYDTLTQREIRKRLAQDTGFAIQMAAAYLHELTSRHGFDARGAFIAYAFGPGEFRRLKEMGFSWPDARKRGQKYDKLRPQIAGHYP